MNEYIPFYLGEQISNCKLKFKKIPGDLITFGENLLGKDFLRNIIKPFSHVQYLLFNFEAGVMTKYVLEYNYKYSLENDRAFLNNRFGMLSKLYIILASWVFSIYNQS